VDCALCGAADNPAHPATMVHLAQAGLLRSGEFPAAAAAYLVLERAETAARDGRRAYARIAAMKLAALDDGAPTTDPLAARMGRTLAAAPAVLLGLAALAGEGRFAVSGADRQVFTAELGAPA